MLIDLLAIAPFFLGFFFDLRFRRLLRLIRFLRLFKLARYSRSMRLFVAVIGIGLFALLASILASGFVEESQHETKYACPHCGERVSEHELHELK